MTADISLSVGRRRILDHLKLFGPATPAELAHALSLTPAAIRQHLDGLAAEGLVTRLRASRATASGAGPGRPAATWQLTRRAHRLFPDRHGELTAQLIGAIRTVAGTDVLDAVIEARTAAQRADYEAAIGAGGQSLREKVESLARCRTAEGYMAEVVPVDANDSNGDAGADPDTDGVLLIEHHCPICEAAQACLGFCRAELEVFQAVLGDGVTLEREEHLLSGGERCAYRVRAGNARGGVPVEVGLLRR